MGVQVTINSITGAQEPFDIYLCSSGGTGCFYISTINSVDIPYVFDVPTPYDNSQSYMLKIIDDNDCEITEVETL